MLKQHQNIPKLKNTWIKIILLWIKKNAQNAANSPAGLGRLGPCWSVRPPKHVPNLSGVKVDNYEGRFWDGHEQWPNSGARWMLAHTAHKILKFLPTDGCFLGNRRKCWDFYCSSVCRTSVLVISQKPWRNIIKTSRWYWAKMNH